MSLLGNSTAPTGNNSTSLLGSINDVLSSNVALFGFIVVGVFLLLLGFRFGMVARRKAHEQREAQARAELAAALAAKARSDRLSRLAQPRAYINPLRVATMANGEVELVSPGVEVNEADIPAIEPMEAHKERPRWTVNALMTSIVLPDLGHDSASVVSESQRSRNDSAGPGSLLGSERQLLGRPGRSAPPPARGSDAAVTRRAVRRSKRGLKPTSSAVAVDVGGASAAGAAGAAAPRRGVLRQASLRSLRSAVSGVTFASEGTSRDSSRLSDREEGSPSADTADASRLDEEVPAPPPPSAARVLDAGFDDGNDDGADLAVASAEYEAQTEAAAAARNAPHEARGSLQLLLSGAAAAGGSTEASAALAAPAEPKARPAQVPPPEASVPQPAAEPAPAPPPEPPAAPTAAVNFAAAAAKAAAAASQQSIAAEPGLVGRLSRAAQLAKKSGVANAGASAAAAAAAAQPPLMPLRGLGAAPGTGTSARTLTAALGMAGAPLAPPAAAGAGATATVGGVASFLSGLQAAPPPPPT